MSRSTRGTLSSVAVLAMLIGVIAPIASATVASAAPSRSTAVDWTQVPGATADDLIVNPYSNYLGAYLGPGFSYTGRPASAGIADFCAATDTTGAYPCPFSDYHDYFTLNSATANGLGATINVTVTNTHSTNSYLSFTSDSRDTWQQVFSTTSHGWLNFAELIGGQQVGQSSTNQVVCQLGVPCTVNFSMTDDYGRFIGNQWLATSLNVANQIFIPLNVSNPVVTPPTGAFSASLSGTTAHDWAFDGSASTAVTPATVASYRWAYGDGSTETTTTATTHHTYADGSPHTASLVVVDSAGTASVSVSHDLTEPALIVNSTGDAPATDPSAGCDTGRKVQNGDIECTLRAAIQSLDAGVGGTKITFDLPAGSTTITAASVLPSIIAPNATIQGISGPAMPVISGSGLKVLGAAGVSIADISTIGGTFGVSFLNSPGGKLTGSMIGVSPSGQVSAPAQGVTVAGGGTYTIGGSSGAGNVVIGTNIGLAIRATAPISSVQVIGNTVGELPNGSLALDDHAAGGIDLYALTSSISGAVVQNNTVAGSLTNLAVIGDQMIAPTIIGNTLGVAADQDTLVGKPKVNLRVDGAPGARIFDNIMAGATWDLLISGSVQASVESRDDGSQYVVFEDPGVAHPLPTPVTGTHVTISGNRVGPVTRHDGANLLHGITLWNAANATTVSANVARNHDTDDISVSGAASAMTVSDNLVGSAPTTPVGGEDGIVVADQTAPTIATNTVGGVATGITIPATTTGAIVSGNTVGLWTDGVTVDKTGIGIDVRGAGATIGPDNTIGFSTISGIFLHASGARVISNRIGIAKFGSGSAPNVTGIQVGSDAVGAKIGGSGSGNTIAANVTGVLLEGQGVEVSWNKFGLITGGVLGNATSIAAYASSSIHDNTIAGSLDKGVTVSPGAVVKILHNVIYGTGGFDGINTRLASSVLILAAPRVTHGTSTRTWLVLSGVPTAPGTIEVFGNPSCADPEGKVPLLTTPTTSSDSRVLSVADRVDLVGFTVTVTTDAGTTRFSNCATAGPSADSDGDGIPDLVEFSSPLPDSAVIPNKAAFVGDNQQWVFMTATTGKLSNVSVLDDPDPTGHPGVTFPLGLIDWTVSGLTPGTFAQVGFSLPGTAITHWWKYDPGHSPPFFNFDFTDANGYGAVLSQVPSQQFGTSTVVSEIVDDGGVGDDDGAANGVVHDPVAPAILDSDVTPPATPVVFPTGTATVSRASASPSALARTGTDSQHGVDVAVMLVMFGALVLVAARRVRRPRSTAHR